MNGAHDLGGMQGFGPIDVESGRKLFHAEWEERVFALTLACGFLGKWNIDQSRFARERMDPADYLQSSYYEHWLHGLETLLVERGVIGESELRSGQSSATTDIAVLPERIDAILQTGGPANCKSDKGAAYAVGDTVEIKNDHPVGHTRAPRFIRGRCGVIERHHGAHVLPDVSSGEAGLRVGAHLYNVRFDAVELWGADGDGNSAVYVDVFEPYISRAL